MVSLLLRWKGRIWKPLGSWDDILRISSLNPQGPDCVKNIDGVVGHTSLLDVAAKDADILVGPKRDGKSLTGITSTGLHFGAHRNGVEQELALHWIGWTASSARSHPREACGCSLAFMG